MSIGPLSADEALTAIREGDVCKLRLILAAMISDIIAIEAGHSAYAGVVKAESKQLHERADATAKQSADAAREGLLNHVQGHPLS